MTPTPTPPTEPAAAAQDGFNLPNYRKKLSFAIKMLLIFSGTYFFAALIATRDLKHIGQIQILGMPLALYTALLVFVVGLVVTRMCLAKDEGDKS